MWIAKVVMACGHPGRMKILDPCVVLAAGTPSVELGALSPSKVWRGSLARNPGLVPLSPLFRFDCDRDSWRPVRSC